MLFWMTMNNHNNKYEHHDQQKPDNKEITRTISFKYLRQRCKLTNQLDVWDY